LNCIIEGKPIPHELRGEGEQLQKDLFYDAAQDGK
jgi:hypothetical protein